jgi:hypothetical protein
MGCGLDHDRSAPGRALWACSAPLRRPISIRASASFIFRAGFTTVGDGARGTGMDVVRELVNKAGGRVGIATNQVNTRASASPCR